MKSALMVAENNASASSNSSFLLLLRSCRPQQWVKNFLVIVPAITAHKVFNQELAAVVFMAFVAFCSVSSSIYLINDSIDREFDRQHHTKRKRPIASGTLSVFTALLAASFLAVSGIVISLFITNEFLFVVFCYAVLSLFYSLWLKRLVIVDGIVLALLYTARIIAGGAATNILVSEWLLAFSFFIFLSLALVKRYVELQHLRTVGVVNAVGRGYLAKDLEIVASLGTAGSYLSVLVLALYINSEKVATLYAYPMALWGICLLLIYWLSRVWLLAHRGQMDSDPISFAVRDIDSYAVAFFSGLILFFAA